MNVFIDTNVLLSLYHYNEDDLEELNKILALIDNEKLFLFTTDQVVDEFWRNRETKIADALDTFAKANLPTSYPRLITNHPKFKELQKATRDFSTNLKEIKEEVLDKSGSKTLSADTTITNLLSRATQVEITDGIQSKASKRMSLGRPPGKKGSVGDAINWEALLYKISEGSDIHIISKDGDFDSDLFSGTIKDYLKEEWTQNKKAQAFLYKDLSSFLKQHFPEVKVSEDVTRVAAVDLLEKSGTFTQSHKAIAALSTRLGELLEEEVDRIKSSLLSNDQIYWIANDHDVFWFANEFFNRFSDKFTQDEAARMEELYFAGQQLSYSEAEELGLI